MLHACSSQYNVTVSGVSRTGQRTKGDNWLPLVMPSGLLLTKAKATGYTTGVATARALPGDAYTKVRVLRLAAVQQVSSRC